MSHWQFHHELTELCATLAGTQHASCVATTGFYPLHADRPPWQSTGLKVRRGQAYSIFGRGRIHWSERRKDLYGEPGFHLWARVSPGGKIVNLAAESGSFTADVDGTVELGIYMGMWANDTGELVDTQAYARISGTLYAALVLWNDDAATCFNNLSFLGRCPELITAEKMRLQRDTALPENWSYLLEIGTAEMYHDMTRGEKRQLLIDAVNDQGIIRYPIEVPLSLQTTLSWDWRIDEHPSAGPEDRADCHDYISIATEFDNGRDLTWIWSQHLERDKHFHCPVRAWTARETHYVVRTGDDPLGEWVSDSRNIFSDVEISQGIPPANIVAVWLIAVSTFSHRRVRAQFANISLSDGDRCVQVL